MIPEAVTDMLAVIILFAVRVGIPIAITLAFGYWLEKKLQPSQAKDRQRVIELTRRERPNKVIQLHCWDVRHCESANLAACAAHQHPELPCWLALQVVGGKVREECFTCGLYRPDAAAA